MLLTSEPEKNIMGGNETLSTPFLLHSSPFCEQTFSFHVSSHLILFYSCQSYITFVCHLYFPDHKGLSLPVILDFPVLTLLLSPPANNVKISQNCETVIGALCYNKFCRRFCISWFEGWLLKRKSKTYDPE